MKKHLSLILTIIFVINVCFSTPFTLKANAASVDDLTFELNSDGQSYYVASCDTSASGEIEIPDTYNDLPVTSIGQEAFRNCTSLTSINIPDSVTSIGSNAFDYCTSLTSINIPNGVTSIGKLAFYNCKSLTSVNIPDGVTSISDGAFYYCTSLESVTIHNGVTIIGDYAFRYCSSLTSINIPESVTSIGEAAFYYCTSLTSVNIPESVTTIEIDAFYNCGSLTSVNITNLEAWCNIDFANNRSNPLCIAKNLYLNGELITNLVIPESVTEIKASTFSGCTSLESVTIHNGVTIIGDYAFLYCSSLPSVNIPNNVTIIGDQAFAYCTSLTNITIPDSVTSIGSKAFDSCTSLTSINISNSVTSIGSEAFAYCSSLTSVNITDLAAWCNIDFADYNSNPLYYAKNLYLNGELVTDLVIPEGVTEIKPRAFYNYRPLESVSIPNSVTNIGTSAFYFCSSLASINIPNSVTNIGPSAFDNCTSLTNITLPDSVTIIGDCAFFMCSSLTTITIPKGVTSIGEEVFLYSSITEINVSSENNNYASIDGVLFNKNKTILIKMPEAKKITSYIIPDGVTSIGKNAFSHCSSLTSITLPDSVTSIGEYAFSHCGNLEKITMPNNITSIDRYTFYYCKSLKSINIPEGVTNIGYGAFYYCYSLTNITIPDSVTSIDYYAFANCKELKYVFYTGSSTDWLNIDRKDSGNDNLFFNPIHYNTTKHSHSLTTYLPTSANNYGHIIDKCPICGFCNSMTMVVYLNNYIAAVGGKNVVIDSTNNYIILDISASKNLSEAILPMEGYKLTTTPSSDYGFFGTGSKVQVTDSNGTQVAEYTLVVRGDVNGDSVCDVFDLMAMQTAIINPTTFEGVYFVAGDLTEDGEITDTDFEAVVTKALS